MKTLILILSVLLFACSSSPGVTPTPDAGQDASVDAGPEWPLPESVADYCGRWDGTCQEGLAYSCYSKTEAGYEWNPTAGPSPDWGVGECHLETTDGMTSTCCEHDKCLHIPVFDDACKPGETAVICNTAGTTPPPVGCRQTGTEPFIYCC